MKCMTWWRDQWAFLILQETFFALSPGQAGSVSRVHHLCTSNPILQAAFDIQRMLKQIKSSKQLTAKWFYACTCESRQGVELQAGKALHQPSPVVGAAVICPSVLGICQSTVALHREQCCCSSPENVVGGSYLRFFSRQLFLHSLNRSQKEKERFFTGLVLAFAYYRNHL